jgi:hypothetical protein
MFASRRSQQIEAGLPRSSGFGPAIIRSRLTRGVAVVEDALDAFLKTSRTQVNGQIIWSPEGWIQKITAQTQH